MHLAVAPSFSCRQIVALAQTLNVTHAEAAAGRCLALSLELASEALREHGLQLELVTWRVRGDPTYADHWAVQLDDDHVVDLTRVQVDGSTRLVSPLDDYPRHYVRRRVYPARLLLGAYGEPGAADGALLSPRFMWGCRMRLLRFDFGRAVRELNVVGLASALREAVAFLGCFGVACLLHRLHGREITLRARLKQVEAAPPESSLPRREADRAARRLNEPCSRFG